MGEEAKTVLVAGPLVEPRGTFEGFDLVLTDVMVERTRIRLDWPNEETMPDGTRHGGGKLVQLAHARQAVERAAKENRVTHALVFEEEVFEVMTEEAPAKLRAELVQVVACALRWIQDIDRRLAAPLVQGNTP